MRGTLERMALYGVATMLFMDSLIKLFPKMIPESTVAIDRRFAEYSTVCITSMFGYMPDPIIYKIIVGSWQICSAIGLIFQEVRQTACIILGIIMLGAVQTFINLKEYGQMFFPVILFFTLCYFYGMGNRKPQTERTELEKKKRK